MFVCYLLKACSFLMKDRKGMGTEGRRGEEELAGAKAEETIIRLYCLRKESIFNKRKNLFPLKNQLI